MHDFLITVTKSELNTLYKLATKGDRKATVRLDHLLNLFLNLRDEALEYEKVHESQMPTM